MSRLSGQFLNLQTDTDILEDRRREFNGLFETVTNNDETGGGAFLHDYAKKESNNVISGRESLLECIDDTDRLEEMRTGIDHGGSSEICRAVANDDETIVGASLHDYAKKNSNEYEYLLEGNFYSDRWRLMESESNRHCETVKNYDETGGGGPSLHDYAKKVIDDHESLLESFLDPDMFREMRKEESNEITTNYVGGCASVHDYAKKAFDYHENLLESIFNPDMLTRKDAYQGPNDIITNYVGGCVSGHDYAKKGNYGHKNLLESIFVPDILSETRKETNQESNEIITNYVGGCVSGHDYAKKGVEDHESLFESILDRDMLREMEKETNQGSNELFQIVTNDNGGASLHDYAKKLIDGNEKSLSENVINSDVTRELRREFNKYASRLGKTLTNNYETCVEVHDYAKKVSNVVEDHESLLESILDPDKLGEIGKDFDQGSNSLGNVVTNYGCGGTSVHNYAKRLDGNHESLLEFEFNTDTLEEIRNEFDKDSNHKLMTNDGEICEEASVHDYAKQITHEVIGDHEKFSESISDPDRLEGMRNELHQDSIELCKLGANDGIGMEASEHENDRNVMNAIDDHESIDDSGRKPRSMLICLFCDAKFKSANSMYRHDSKYHYELKRRLKMEDSEVRCKQCDALVVYSKIRAHMDSHLTEENMCQLCNLQFRSLKRLEMHAKTHMNAENFCPYCGKEFTNIRNKLIHIKKMHKEGMDNLCDVCGLLFQSQKRLKSHLKMHHKPGEFFCSYCGKEFSTVGNKLMHMKLHSADPRDVLCEVCGRLFLDLRSLASHQRLHTNQGGFVCKTCTKLFQTGAELDAHVSSHLKSYSCQLCSKRFHRKNLVQQHMLSHSDVKPFSCFCGVSFNRYGNFRLHMNRHKQLSNSSNKSDDKQIPSNSYECSICKRNLKSQLRLRWHEAKHRGEKKPFDCDLCDCRFAKLDYYKVHMMKHTGERPYKCLVCQQGFRTLHTLQQHTILHMDIYPFKCDDCGHIFKQRNSLTVHKVIHTGDKPYECQICGLRYTQKASLSRHLKLHTNSTGSKTSSCSEALIEVEQALTTPFSFGAANEPVLMR